MRKYLITGANGLVGSALRKILGENHIYHTKAEVDFLDPIKTHEYITYHVENNQVNTIIHCAAKVGGVQANMMGSGDFFINNFIINNNIITSAYKNKIPNFVNLLSTCVFPAENITYPLTPDQIDNGKPHYTNKGYAYAKRIAGYQTKAIKHELEANWVSIAPTNVYGPHDNFNLFSGHMVPAMIHRAYQSKINNKNMVVWGDGSQLRQLIYSEDLARLILWSLDNWDSDYPFMAVDPTEHSVMEVSNLICNNLGISNKDITFDTTKPVGQLRKPSISNAPDGFQFTSIEEGIKQTIKWFTANYNTLRK